MAAPSSLSLPGMNRRGFLGLLGMASASGILISACGSGDATSEAQAGAGRLTMQMNWNGDYGVLGECVALEQGYYDELGLELEMMPGGPSIDPVNLLAAGAAMSGQSSSPAVMLARSQGLPVKTFAAVSQRHPYAYFSLPRRRVLTPQDLIGATVGVPATGVILLEALLAKNGIARDQVKVETVGSDWAVLASGRVDVMTGYLTSVAGREVLGEDVSTLSLEDAGIHLFAYIYNTTDQVLQTAPKALEALLVGSARGWELARNDPKAAVQMLKARFPNVKEEAQLRSAELISDYIWTDDTRTQGFGYMSEQVWKDQIDMWARLGQFKGTVPTVSDVMTTAILDATTAQRVKG